MVSNLAELTESLRKNYSGEARGGASQQDRFLVSQKGDALREELRAKGRAVFQDGSGRRFLIVRKAGAGR